MNVAEQIQALQAQKERNGRRVSGLRLARINRDIRSLRLQAARAQGTHTGQEWLALVAEFHGRCVCCGCHPFGGPCKDHVLPVYLGGSDSIGNLQPLCRACNASKGPDDFNWAEHRRRHGFEAAA